MQQIKIDSEFNWIDLTPEAGSHFFGYYTRCPWDAEVRRHLAIRIQQEDRLPTPGEKADLGFIDRSTRTFTKFAETHAWALHDGCCAMWLEHMPGAVIFNDFIQDGSGWRSVSRILDPEKAELGRYEGHLWSMSPDGRWGASVDFGRIDSSESCLALAPPPAERKAPDLDNDGLFLVDLHSGERKLVAPYRVFYEAHPFPDAIEGQYAFLWIPLFNCDSTRIMAILAHKPHPHGPLGPISWTHLFTVNIDGSDVRCPLPDMYWRSHGGITHAVWGRYADEILTDANWFSTSYECMVPRENHIPAQWRSLAKGLDGAGHLTFSPCGRWIVYDVYTDHDQVQRLFLIHVESGDIIRLGNFTNHVTEPWGPRRCDLHSRWSPDSRYITVDSTHFGHRKILMLDVKDVLSSDM